MSSKTKKPTDTAPASQLERVNEQLGSSRRELEILTAIQDGVASGMDIDSIFEVAGDQVAKAFPGKGVALYTYNPDTHWGEPKYILEKGVRHYPPAFESGPIGKKAAKAKKALMISTRKEFDDIGAITLPGTEPSLSGMFTPMIVNDRVVGALNIESTEAEHAFSEEDLAFVTTIAKSLSVALNNASLLKETEERNAELVIINSIQKGLATHQDIDAIFELVGEQLSAIFPGKGIGIYTIDTDTKMGEGRYVLERGVRKYPSPIRYGPIATHLIKTKLPLMLSSRKEFEAIGSTTVEGTETSMSGVYGPLLRKGEVVGVFNIEDLDREHAFSEADVRLATTIASSMSVALESARLFVEVQKRASELAIINDVQAGLAAQINLQEIYDLVGDRIQEIFDAEVVVISRFDVSSNLITYEYAVEKGKRLYVDPQPFNPIIEKFLEEKTTLLVNSGVKDWMESAGAPVVAGERPLSVLSVPLLRDESVIGSISLQNITKEHAFNEVDIQLLETLAASLTVALENARLFKETEERNAELAIINTVQRALSAELDIHGIYEAVGEKLREIFDSQIIAIYTADLVNRINTTAYAYEKGQKFEPVSIPFSSLHEHLIDLDDTYLFNGDFPEFAAQFPDYRVSAGELPKSIVGVPVIRKKDGTQLVTLTLQDIDGERFFNEGDVRLLETLASSMSVALENARLFDETQHLLDETEQRAAELEIINSVQEGLASKLEMQAIYDLVGEKIREIFNADTTFIAFHDKEQDLMVAPYYTDKGEKLLGSGRPYGKGLAENIIESGKPVIYGTSDEMADAGAYNISSPGSDKDLNQSFLGVPIFRQGVPIGATSVQSYQQHAFDENDLRLLQTLTNSMSVALENARLFDETQHLLKQTAARATELATINAVGQAIVAESELETLIELIGEKMRNTFAADIVYIALLDEEVDLIHFPYTHGEELKPIRLGEGLTSKIIQSGEPLLINKEIEKRRAEMGIDRVGVRAASYLGVPIKLGDQTFGVISVQNTSEEDRFSESDLNILSTIAVNVASALRNARLFDQVTRQKQYYEAVIQNSPAAIVLLDNQAIVTGWNPAAERLFGYREEEALGMNVDSLVAVSPDLHSEAVRYSEKAMEEKQLHILTRRTRKDGSLIEVEVSGLPVFVDGENVGFIAIYHDVTELQRARQEAEEANQAKSRFLANMSHELRTPLNAIIGFSRIVRRKGEEVLPEKQVENLDKVLVSADHLLNLINTVLDISKIEAGRMDVEPSIVALAPLVDLVVDTSQPLLRDGVQLRTDLQPDLPELFSDEEKLKQILLNLLSNAAKFTHDGVITLGSRHDHERLYIDVNDTGIGVSEDALARIFEDFQQADSSTTREYGGTGLGLPISRSLARLLGGDLTACSIEGEGSTFTLTLPIKYEEPGTEVESVS